MTTYRVPVADPLLADRDYWEPVEGLRLISVDGPWLAHPDVTICTFEDDDAPGELEGKLVEPVLHSEYNPDGTVASVRVSERNLVAS